MKQRFIVFTAPVRRSRRLRLAYAEKQIVFLSLKLFVLALERSKVVLSTCLLCPRLIFLLRCLRFLSRCFFLLFSDLLESCALLRRVNASFLGIITKALLNILGKFGEINFRDARLTGEHDAVRFDPTHRDVLIFFSSKCFKIVGEGERDERQAQKDKRFYLHAVDSIPTVLFSKYRFSSQENSWKRGGTIASTGILSCFIVFMKSGEVPRTPKRMQNLNALGHTGFCGETSEF